MEIKKYKKKINTDVKFDEGLKTYGYISYCGQGRLVYPRR